MRISDFLGPAEGDAPPAPSSATEPDAPPPETDRGTGEAPALAFHQLLDEADLPASPAVPPSGSREPADEPGPGPGEPEGTSAPPLTLPRPDDDLLPSRRRRRR
ncbi:MAG: hypothetical protein M5U14_14270 [Acidimicrobiia bacterium]|nr:hypothetical protein [Acidimicrobiia bacterium]